MSNRTLRRDGEPVPLLRNQRNKDFVPSTIMGRVPDHTLNLPSMNRVTVHHLRETTSTDRERGPSRRRRETRGPQLGGTHPVSSVFFHHPPLELPYYMSRYPTHSPDPR